MSQSLGRGQEHKLQASCVLVLSFEKETSVAEQILPGGPFIHLCLQPSVARVVHHEEHDSVRARVTVVS